MALPFLTGSPVGALVATFLPRKKGGDWGRGVFLVILRPQPRTAEGWVWSSQPEQQARKGSGCVGAWLPCSRTRTRSFPV